MVDVRVGRCENAQNDEKLTRLHPHSAPFKKLFFYSAGNFNYTPAESVSLSVCPGDSYKYNTRQMMMMMINI